MKSKIPLILLCVSVALNGILILTHIVSNYAPSFVYDNTDFEKVAAANIVTSPQGSEVIFNPIDITLQRGQSASIQFSVMFNHKQLNWMTETLYDRNVVTVTKNPFGITISAVAPGSAVLQTLTDDGIKDIARVTVSN